MHTRIYVAATAAVSVAAVATVVAAVEAASLRFPNQGMAQNGEIATNSCRR